MRDSIGGIWVLGIIMVFMAIFIAYVAISINYSTAYTLKSKIVSVIEKYEGMNNYSLEMIDELIRDNAYNNKFLCRKPNHGSDDRVFGITDKNWTLNPTTAQSYCVTRDFRPHSNDSEEDQYYYTVTLTFALDVPILGSLVNFRVSGETNGIVYPNELIFT